MSNITITWENERIFYQQRYIMWLKKFQATNSEYYRGHVLECSYVLINVFGLTSEQIKELEHDYSGFLNDDLE